MLIYRATHFGHPHCHPYDLIGTVKFNQSPTAEVVSCFFWTTTENIIVTRSGSISNSYQSVINILRFPA